MSNSRRLWLFALASTLTLVTTFTTSFARAADDLPLIRHAKLTATPNRGLSVVLATIKNQSAHPLTLYRVSSTVSPEAMLHYDVNMCQKGTQMNLLPMVIVPAHRTLRLSTRGVGAMLSPVHQKLVVGQSLTVKFRYSLNLQIHTLSVTATVVPAPVGLNVLPKKSTVG